MQDIKTNILISKLDAFIKKFYLNRIIKGLIISLTLLGVLYLSIVIPEYFGRFSIAMRTFLFWTLIISSLAVIGLMIIYPMLKLFKIGKCISYREASKILGQHFPEISDKLQNTLELNDLLKDESYDKSILLASINQRTMQLSPMPFVNAIKFSKNLVYLRYLIPVLVIIISMFLFWPYIITEGTERIVNYNTYYETPAPFSFELMNDTLSVRRGGDFNIKLRTPGKYSPDQVLLHYIDNAFYMEQESPGVFNFTLKNLNNDIEFYFTALDQQSKSYIVRVLPAPVIVDFTINIAPPVYTNIERSTINNSGDISVPVGSEVEWIFNTANLLKLKAVFDTTEIKADKDKALFRFNKRILNPGSYRIISENQYFSEQTGLTYQINVIPDLFPTINVEELRDSADLSVYYFNGIIDDDYGFNSLNFNYIPGENSDTIISLNIPFSRNMRTQTFFFAFDFSAVEVKGRQLSYYFEVGDNDAVHGSKKTRTQVREFIIPTSRDLQAESERAMESAEKNINEAQSLADEINRDINRLKQDIIDNQLSEWERTQSIQQIIDKQKQLENMMQNVAEEQENLNQMKEQWGKDEELAEKHQQIQDLLDALMDDEMKELLEKLQELAKDFDMSEFQDLMNEMEQNTEDMNARMDKALELLKRMEIEERLKNAVKDLEELAQEHDKLSQETLDEDSNQQELKDKQVEHQKSIEEIKEDYQKTKEKNEDLKKPYDLEDFSQDFQDILDNMEKSNEQLDNNDNQGASESQKSDSQKMQELSDQMQMMMDAQMQQQHMENMQHLRQILDNLLFFSFEQEDIMINQRNIGNRDPRYRDFMIRQRRSIDNFSIIRDSLNALGSRVPELGPSIDQEQAEIYRNLDVIMENMAENRQARVQSSQQLVMTSANNLALMLSEVLEQMQQQMAMQMGGEGGECNKCQSPGDGEMGRMRNMQEGLKQQLQQMIDQMQNGMNPGQGQSEELAKMLKQQEIMQKMMNDMMNSGISPDAARILQEINRMIEENISDLINRNITPETINRQDMIISRLLKAEKSEREREIDNKRESNEAIEYKLSNPDKAFKEKEQEIRFDELLQISNIKLNSFYQDRYKEYLKKLGGE
jgi:hypothetical protein